MKIEKRFKSTKIAKEKTSGSKKGGPIVEFIILGEGKNIHKTMPYTKDAKYETEASAPTTYKVDPDNLFVVKPFLGRKKLVAIFKSDGTAVKIEGSTSKITAEILDLANRSTALGRTIKEMFTQHMNMKKILFFIVIGVVGVVAFLILTGGIRI